MSHLVRRAGAPPLYAQLATILTAQIRAGEHAVGDMLPSEHALASTYGLSRATVIRALDTLSDNGLVTKRQGKGSIVTATPLDRPLNGLGGFTQHVTSQGRRPSQELMSRAPVPHSDDPLHEPFPAGTPLFEMVRRRLVDGVPVGTQRSIIPLVVAEAIHLHDEGVTDPDFSLYVRLENSPYAPRRARETLRAINSSDEEAALLGVEPGTALIEATRQSTDGSGNIVEVVQAHYLGSWYVYRVELSGKDQLTAG